MESFERNQLQHYSGGTSAYEITSGWSYNGSKSLEMTDDSSQPDKIISTSGLDYYPERGDTIRVVFRPKDFSTADWCDPSASMYFGGEDSSTYYKVKQVYRADPKTNAKGIRIVKSSSGKLSNSSDIPEYSEGDIFSWEIEYGKEEITVKTYTGYLDQLEENISAQDTEFDGGNLGFRVRSACSEHNIVNVDYVNTQDQGPNKPKDLEPPNETTTTNQSVEISALYTHDGGKEGSLRFWNEESGQKGTRSWKYTDHEEFVRNIAVGADGKYLFTGSYDKEVHKIDVSDGSNSWMYNGHTNWVDDVATGPNAKYSYSGGRDDEVHQVDVSDGSNSWIYNGHSNNLKDLAAGPAGKAVYSASIGEGIHKINASSGKQIWTTQASKTFEGIHAGPDRNYIYGGGDREVQQIDVSDGSNGWIYDEHSEESNDVKVSPDGKSVYIGAGYAGVHKINSSNGDQVWTSPAQDFVRAVSVGPNGRNLYSADGDKVYQLNASDGSNGWNYSGHSNNVADVAAGPNGDYVYSGSADEEVHQINARDGSLIGTCNVQDGSRCGVNYDLSSGDNFWFVDAESDGNISERSLLYNVIKGGNKAPDKVNDPESPKDGEWINDSSTVFNVSVSDPDGDDLEVKFRNNVSNQTSAGTASGVSSGDFATVEKDLERGETYKWWVNVSDQQNYTKSGSWSFYVNSLPSLDSFEPSDGSIIRDDAIYLNATGFDKESSELSAYFYDDKGGFLGKDSGPETDKLVSDKWSNLDIGQVYKWEVRLSDREENRTFGLFSFIRSTGSNYRLNMSFDIYYSSIISSPDSSEIFLLTVENKAGVPRSVTTYLEGVNSVFPESGKDSVSYNLEPYGKKEMIVRVEPEEEGEKVLSVTTKDENIRINTTEKIPVTVRNTPATLESKEVSGIGTAQLIMLVLSAVYLYSVRL
ncbi:MAG: hypothetical protein BRC27_01590 [Nanohaloarchaea archaeon SW_10_44_10]|nr:MAG: hypothetical protein BRC27_01590 [Nanohaloarchaea archaeon SW_10_44_10]